MVVSTLSTKFIVGIIFGLIVGLLYFLCCFYSLRKAIRDRREILQRNFQRRNAKYLHEMGIDSNNVKGVLDYPITNDNTTVKFQMDQLKDSGDNNDRNGYHEITNARKINLDDIDEILNESISNSSSGTKLMDVNKKEVRKFNKSSETGPRITYLKARNTNLREENKPPPSNWITNRLEAAIAFNNTNISHADASSSSYAAAQKQLQFGFKRAPLAKQNSGFSSMEEESSSASFTS